MCCVCMWGGGWVLYPPHDKNLQQKTGLRYIAILLRKTLTLQKETPPLLNRHNNNIHKVVIHNIIFKAES